MSIFCKESTQKKAAKKFKEASAAYEHDPSQHMCNIEHEHFEEDEEHNHGENDDLNEQLHGDDEENLNQDNYSLYDELDETEEISANAVGGGGNIGLNTSFFSNAFRAANMNSNIINDDGESETHNTYTTNGKSGNSRRNRVFIDPITEVPILEHYFSIETYPDHFLIEKICEILNNGEYRYKFPKLEPRNIQLWFKNHRAKLKRLKTTGSSGNLETGST